MLNLKKFFADRTFKIRFIVVMLVLLAYAILRIIYYPNNPVASWLSPVFETYLLIPEWIANLIFSSADAPLVSSPIVQIPVDEI